MPDLAPDPLGPDGPYLDPLGTVPDGEPMLAEVGSPEHRAALAEIYGPNHDSWEAFELRANALGVSVEDYAYGAFDPSSIAARAKRAWTAAGLLSLTIDRDVEIAPRPITLHEARHTYASLMIAAMADAGRFNLKALSVYMGHASVAFTLDRYGHLIPGNEAEAASDFGAYLERSNTDARLAALAA